MANQRDIDRWKKGREHWNKWARECLKAKEKLEKERKWEIDERGNGVNADTKRWINSASVDFSEHGFKEHTEFVGFLFPHNANFSKVEFKNTSRFDGAIFLSIAFFEEALFLKTSWFAGAKFSSTAWFDRAIFSGSARFDRATFSGVAWFPGAKFFGDTRFAESRFSGVAWFTNTTFYSTAAFERTAFSGAARFRGAVFSGAAKFHQCIFEDETSFEWSRFNASSSFNSTESKGPFSLTKASFLHVPDFIQMSFREPARLDDLEIVQAPPFRLHGDKENAARYRALKKLAIESHDHVREQDFFASEIKERRGNDDHMLHARWLFGIAYELFSDFGRSITRPLGWLVISLLAFAAIFGTGTRSACAWPTNSWVLPEIYLSFLNSLPLVGFARAHGRELAETCLFGSPEAIRPGMDIVFIAQNIWSAVLIFLFLLAVRNHFRIK